MITQQLKKTISVIHSKNNEYKTAIQGSEPHLHLVATRVNYLTASLWLNEVKKLKTNKTEQLPQKPNWLVMVKSFRREFQTNE